MVRTHTVRPRWAHTVPHTGTVRVCSSSQSTQLVATVLSLPALPALPCSCAPAYPLPPAVRATWFGDCLSAFRSDVSPSLASPQVSIQIHRPTTLSVYYIYTKKNILSRRPLRPCWRSGSLFLQFLPFLLPQVMSHPGIPLKGPKSPVALLRTPRPTPPTLRDSGSS